METKTNYETEAEKVTAGGDWIKLGVGVHKLVFLEDLPTPVKTKIVINGKEKESERCDVLVEYQGQRKKLSLTRGASIKSFWGQVVLLGKHYKSLVGKSVDVIVKTAKDKNGEDRKDYTILQVAELLQQQPLQK